MRIGANDLEVVTEELEREAGRVGCAVRDVGLRRGDLLGAKLRRLGDAPRLERGDARLIFALGVLLRLGDLGDASADRDRRTRAEHEGALVAEQEEHLGGLAREAPGEARRRARLERRLGRDRDRQDRVRVSPDVAREASRPDPARLLDVLPRLALALAHRLDEGAIHLGHDEDDVRNDLADEL